MGGLILKSNKQAGLLKAQNKKSGVPFFQPDYKKAKTKSGKQINVAYVYICPPKDEDTPLVTKVSIHEAFSQKGKLTDALVSVSNFDEKSDITQLGFDLMKKYKEHKNESLKKLHQYFLPKEKNIIFVIDPEDPEKGIQQWQAPKAVADYLIKYVEGDDEREGGDLSFAHPTEGKLLKIIKTGEKLNTKYDVKFSDKTPDLGEINEENLVEMLAKLPVVLDKENPKNGMFRKPSKEQIQAYKDFLDEYAQGKGITLNWKNTKNSQLETDADAEADLDGDGDGGVDDDELDMDDDSSSKKNNKKETKKAGKKTESDDEETSSDGDSDDDIEVDLDDDFSDDSED